jgi:hypothetical protein
MHLSGENLQLGIAHDIPDVQILHAELQRLGYEELYPDLRQDMEAGVFGEVTRNAVMDFQRARGLPPTGIVDRATAHAINLAVDALAPEEFTVTGRVFHQDGTSLIGLIVQAFDKDLRREERLGEAVTEPEEGEYTIHYSKDQFTRAEKKRADLIVRAYSPEGGLLAESPIHFNAENHEWIDLQVDPQEQAPLSDYERLLVEITPLLDDVALADLTEDDIQFLAQELESREEVREYLTREIQYLRQAAQLAQTIDLPMEALYACGRFIGAEPLTLEILRQSPPDDWMHPLLQAIAEHWIPALDEPTLEAILAQLEALYLAAHPPTDHQVTFRLRQPATAYDLDLRILGSADDIPQAGQRVVFVVKLDATYHARIFDDAGTMVLDRGGDAFVPDNNLIHRLDEAMSQETLDEPTKRELIALITEQLDHPLPQETEAAPLVGFILQAQRLEPSGDWTDLGWAISDGEGQCTFPYTTPHGVDPTPRPFHLELFMPDDDQREQPFATVDVEVPPGLDVVIDLEIEIPEPEEPPSPAIEEVMDVARIPDRPPALNAYLQKKHLETIADIRRTGGLPRQDDWTEADTAMAEILESHANLSILPSPVGLNQELINSGFHNILEIADTPQAEFVDLVTADVPAEGRPELTAQMAQVHTTAVRQKLYLDNLLTAYATERANGFDTPFAHKMEEILARHNGTSSMREISARHDGASPMREISASHNGTSPIQDPCQCHDCESAVSPLAYLADLIDYTLKKVRNDGKPLTFKDLKDNFYQPFGELPVACEEMEKKVRQVRLCIEVLRQYLEDNKPGQTEADALKIAEADYRLDAFQTLLTQLGGSYDELRLLRPQDKEALEAFANRFGIDPHPDRVQRLTNLARNPQTMDESDLEQLFGLQDTDVNRDVLSDGAKIPEANTILKRWNLKGIVWNRHTDAEGTLYVQLTPLSVDGINQSKLYRSPKRQPSDEVASVLRQDDTGPYITLHFYAKNDTDFLASLTIQKPLPNNNRIEIVAIPHILSWRLHRLRTLWQQMDWPEDDFGTKLPVIDPDIIGPDDFRWPFLKANAGDGDQPFDLWHQRRLWVDGRITHFASQVVMLLQDPALNLKIPRLVEGRFLPDLEALFGLMSTTATVAYPPQAPINQAAWPKNVQANFKQWLHNLDRGNNVESITEDIQTQLHLTVESFRRLMALWEKDQAWHKAHPPNAQPEKTASGIQRVTEDEWQELYAILVQALKGFLRETWIQEEQQQDISLDSQIFWPAQRTLLEGGWPPILPATMPIIDPDKVTLEDLGQPTVGIEVWSLWESRRKTLDDRISQLKEASQESFTHLLQAGLPDSVNENQLKKWEQELSNKDTYKKAAEEIQNQLCISVEEFTQLMAIRTKAEATKLKEPEVAPAIVILYTSAKYRQLYKEWAVEQIGTQIDTPIIDPDELNRKDLAEETIGENANDLWLHRQISDFDNFIQEYEQDGFDSLLALVFGDLEPLKKLTEDLNSGGAIQQIAEMAIKRWHLTVETFTRLMYLRTKAQLTKQDLSQAYTILTKSTKYSNAYPQWARDPRNLNLTYWQILKARLPKWRASMETRQAWQQALKVQSKSPVIDPDLLLKTEVNFQPSALGTESRKVWHKRKDQLDQAEKDLRSRDPGDDNPTAFRKMLVEGCFGQTYQDFLAESILSLDKKRANGEDIIPRLKQLGLTVTAFAYLIRCHKLLTEVPAGASPLQQTEWDAIIAILVQATKQRWFAQWRDEEQRQGITLSPDAFQLVEPDPDQPYTPIGSDLPEWRANRLDYLDWRDQLEARIEQQITTITAFAEAISSAEESILPPLRDALILASNAQGTDLSAKAKILTDLLLIDTQAGGCQKTTRISQAIEILQNLLWSIRTGQLDDPYDKLTLTELEIFDVEWKWMGSYTTWRTAMFVFLYPENILIPSLRREQTPTFRELVDNLRKDRRLTPERACHQAKVYEDYLRDICNLELSATCYATTQIYEGTTCSRQNLGTRSLFYIFALERNTKVPYWCAYDPQEKSKSQKALGYWRRISKLQNVDNIIGAYHHNQAIYLFAKVHEENKHKLVYLKYNLSAYTWTDPEDLDLPGDIKDTDDFEVISGRTIDDSKPRLVINNFSVFHSYTQSFDADIPGWDNENFQIIDHRVPGYETSKPLAIYQIRSDSFLVVFQENANKSLYSILYNKSVGSNRDDINHEWKWSDFKKQLKYFGSKNLKSDTFNAGWIGSLRYRNSDKIFVFWRDHKYKKVYSQAVIINGDTLTTASPEEFISTVGSVISSSGTSPEKHWNIVFTDKISNREKHLLCDYLSEDERLIILKKTHLTPHLSGFPEIANSTAFKVLQNRKKKIHQISKENKGDFESIQDYLREAYYFVPMQIALSLSRKGHYIPAISWFRTVYDYTLPVKQNSKRKISYVLTHESGDDIQDYQRDDDWMQDPLNPHLIAASRPNTYTRFTLFSIIRCLLDYANTEFTRDTSESLPRARTLYMTVLELLETKELQQKTGKDCKKVIGEILIDIQEKAKQGNGSGSQGLKRTEIIIPKLRKRLGKFRNPGLLQELKSRINEVINDDLAWDASIKVIDGLVKQSLAQQLVTNNVQRTLEESKQALPILTSFMLADPVIESQLRNGIPVNGNPILNGHSHHQAQSSTSNAATFNFKPYVYCISRNPVLRGLELQTKLNLRKLRTCRNIAGMKREVEPYTSPTDQISGLPQIGSGGQLLLPGTNNIRPTPYRFIFLIERAKQLVNIAQQMESAMLAAFEKRDAEAYTKLKARQDIQLAQSRVRLQRLRVKEASSSIKLVTFQQERSQIQYGHYEKLIQGDLSLAEADAFALQMMLRDEYTFAAATVTGLALSTGMGAVVATELGVKAQEAWVSYLLQKASFERRKEEWEFQKSLAQQDIRISEQQLQIAQNQLKITEQEVTIARLQTDHAKDTLEFLTNKFTNVELYDWMSGVLEGVYSYFLQEATAVAKLAENQLAFERQQMPPQFIQADYWEAPSEDMGLSLQGNAPDRRGLTGSARLLQDIYQLDNYAIETDKRKLQLTKTISLATLAPVEFQQFRETGVLTFRTTLEMCDRDFPGHYLRLIKRVRTSVLALIPPTHGIHATLSTTAASRVVIGGDIFQTVIVRRDPEQVALTSPQDATGLFELQQQSEMLLPFESLGVDTSWEFRMPKAANQFDYSTIADVLLTLEYTALNSYDYQQQVVQTLNPNLSADRPFSFRRQFSDAWYDLHNPDQTATPLTVSFETRRADFPPNLERLKIDQVTLYFARKTGDTFEVPVNLQFTEANLPGQEANPPMGGDATTVDGIISTRRGNGGSWLALQGKGPVGKWELSLVAPDKGREKQIRGWFTGGQIEDILFVITYKGLTPAWPE